MRVTPLGDRLYATEIGEEVELPDDQAKVLIRVGRVAAVVAEGSAAAVENPESVQPKRGPGRPRSATSKPGTYKTRDMKAAGSGQSES